MPDKIIAQVLGGHNVDAVHPAFDTRVVGIYILDVLPARGLLCGRALGLDALGFA